MYIPTSFNHENNKHQSFIEMLKQYMSKETQYNIKELPGLNNEGFDLIITDGKESFNCEIKSNAGADKKGNKYNTWILETYKDHEMEDLPDWRKTQYNIHFLLIYNAATKQAHVYDINQLRHYVWLNESKQVSSGIGTKQYNISDSQKKCGWGLKINWQEPKAGYIYTIDLSNY